MLQRANGRNLLEKVEGNRSLPRSFEVAHWDRVCNRQERPPLRRHVLDGRVMASLRGERRRDTGRV